MSRFPLYLGHRLEDGRRALICELHCSPANADEMARLSAQLRQFVLQPHPHLLTVRGWELKDGRPFLVIDYPLYGNLHDRLPEGAHYPLPKIVSYVTPLAQTLESLHAQQIAHRHLRPEEVWIDARHQLLLSEPMTDLERDFPSDPRSVDYALPEEATERVFPYLAPEQIEGWPGNCSLSDQYAIAVMVYAWLCGECPFKGSWTQIALQHLHTPPPSLRQKVPTIPAEVEEVILTALEKDPQKRFASVQAFATALEQADEPAMRVPEGRSFVYIEKGAEPGRVVELLHPIIYIGRGAVTEYIDHGSAAHLSLADHRVSRRHACLIHQADGNYWIEDDESTSGVLIDGGRLASNKSHLLQNGERLSIGQTVLIFRHGGD